MSTQMPAKIVLKSATSKTLNDRFTEIVHMQAKSPPQVTVTGIHAAQDQLSPASARNRRLAAQMANRPGVQAALGMTSPVSSVQNRLGAVSAARGRGATLGRRGVGLRGRLGTSPVIKRISGRGRFGNAQSISPARGKSFTRGSPGRGKFTRGVTRGTTRGVTRGRGSGQAGRGRGRGRGRQTNPASRDALDAELEQYMSKSKGHLDAELDNYMRHAGEDD